MLQTPAVKKRCHYAPQCIVPLINFSIGLYGTHGAKITRLLLPKKALQIWENCKFAYII